MENYEVLSCLTSENTKSPSRTSEPTLKERQISFGVAKDPVENYEELLNSHLYTITNIENNY
jgi:hypothetical protein